MASSPKFRRQESPLDNVISVIRKTYLAKRVDEDFNLEDFLYDLKVLLETNDNFSIVENNDLVSKSLPALKEETQDVKFECLPDEIVVKIFEYLDFKDISHCAQVSRQLNRISDDSSIWKSRKNLSIYKQTVPSEFLTYILNNGVKALSLKDCKILPPKSSPKKKFEIENFGA